MLKHRIIPTLLFRNNALVKGEGFDSWRIVSVLLPAIKVYQQRQVDELILLDIAATPDNEPPDFDAFIDACKECFIPLTIGGGIKSIEDCERVFKIGGDKVAINTAAYNNPELIEQAATMFGRQAVVGGIDFKRLDENDPNSAICVSHCGEKDHPNLSPVAWAKQVENLGAGELLLSSVTRDGTLTGYDHDVIKQVTDAVSIPVIASGGAKDYDDFHTALTQSGASAVAASAMFQFTEQTPPEAKNHLAAKGLSVREPLTI